ncbi:hypothetical protein NXX09_08400 [Bacteroides uniformis]|nr:hypothetical protein [Bacteroides uniformis]
MKNITEQISIIETNREINASILKGYLPEQNNMQRLPALFGVKEDKSFGSEREILYQVLFDMRQDVTDLKKLVHEIMAERGNGSQSGGCHIGLLYAGYSGGGTSGNIQCPHHYTSFGKAGYSGGR